MQGLVPNLSSLSSFKQRLLKVIARGHLYILITTQAEPKTIVASAVPHPYAVLSSIGPYCHPPQSKTSIAPIIIKNNSDDNHKIMTIMVITLTVATVRKGRTNTRTRMAAVAATIVVIIRIIVISKNR